MVFVVQKLSQSHTQSSRAFLPAARSPGKTLGTVIFFTEFSRVSPGDQPLAKEPEDSRYEIETLQSCQYRNIRTCGVQVFSVVSSFSFLLSLGYCKFSSEPRSQVNSFQIAKFMFYYQNQFLPPMFLNQVAKCIIMAPEKPTAIGRILVAQIF